MVYIRTRSHSALKLKPSAWQIILGRKLITLGSFADPHKEPGSPDLEELLALGP
jgi:hypothetical protein